MIISTKYLITGDGKTVLTDKAVYIGEDRKIGKIAPKEELLKEFPQEEVKEYGDATLLPGLMDMHAHLAYGYSQPDSFNYGAQLIMLYALQHAQAAFERGITTVRDMSSAHGVCKNLKLAEKNGLKSIAFCCISTGEFHFPNKLAAQIAVETVDRYLSGSKLERVIFNVFKEEDEYIYRKLFA